MNYYRLIVFFPLTVIYKFVTSIRNLLFDLKFLKSNTTNIPSIGIGNLSTGGTGKTPVVSFLLEKLNIAHTAVLSRGYGRKTKGYISINNKNTTAEVGDEPKMLFDKHSEKVIFFVCENRVDGYKKIMLEHPKTALLLLDDVFQHRYISPHLLILLIDYNKPFFNDFVLPSGNLRENRAGAKRAEIILVTKCPVNLAEEDKEVFIQKTQRYFNKPSKIFFSNFENSPPKNLENKGITTRKEIIVVSALANNEYFNENLSANYKIKYHHKYLDHYVLNITELEKIIVKSEGLPIVTSQKDYVKIKEILGFEMLKNFYVVDQKLVINNETEFLENIFKVF
jgi:tetraacyldisaccharide 4'-kinase